VEQAELIWMNGEFVAWEDAKVHVLTHGLHYGTGVFEGVRCYDTEIGPAVFRHAEHVDRLFKSAELYYMPLPFTREELREATLELIGRNGLRECYIRPAAFRGYGTMGLFPLEAPVDVTIAAGRGVPTSATTASATASARRSRAGAASRPTRSSRTAKASGQYLNSILAKIESHKAGYEEAILLDDRGNVCEGSGENIFVVRDGVITTPPLSASILDGISRRRRSSSRATSASSSWSGHRPRRALPRRRGLPHGHGGRARPRPRDRRPRDRTGEPGEITRAVQQAFEDALHGRTERYREWLDPVPAFATRST
jgi:branched-chain amino acid aminotransferase